MNSWIETDRLYLFPLTLAQLKMYLKNDGSLEAALKLIPSSRVISLELQEAITQTLIPNFENSGLCIFYTTLWTVILKSESKMVGDLCFYGPPNDQGEIEVGYGTYLDFEGRGIMTEALSGIITWSKGQPTVKSIIATTNKDNPGSMQVLKKNGFCKSHESEDLLHWRLNLK